MEENRNVYQNGQPAWHGQRVLIAILVCSLLLQLAGIIAPGWVVVSSIAVSLNIGLWVFTICGFGVCRTILTQSVPAYVAVSQDLIILTGTRLSEYRGETFMALVCCIIALICALKSRAPASRAPINGATAIFSLGAGVLALVPSGKVLDNTLKVGKELQAIGLPNIYETPYALILTMVGGCLACIGAFIGFWYTYRASQRPPQQPQTINMPQYATATTTAFSTAPHAYPVTNGAYVIEQTNPYIGRQANNAVHVTY